MDEFTAGEKLAELAGNYDFAFDKFLNVSDLSAIIGENYYSAVSNQFIGQIMFKKEMYEKSVEYYIKAGSFWKIFKEPTWTVWTSSALAYVYLVIGENNSSWRKRWCW